MDFCVAFTIGHRRNSGENELCFHPLSFRHAACVLGFTVQPVELLLMFWVRVSDTVCGRSAYRAFGIILYWLYQFINKSILPVKQKK